MNAAPLPLPGTLFGRDGRFTVQLKFATNASVFANFPTGTAPPDRSEFDGLVLEVEDRAYQLSRCRLEVEEAQVDPRLVFLDDVYDFSALFREHRMVDLRRVFHNVALVIAQKDQVSPQFRDYTANTVYDLSVYKRFFADQEAMLRKEPASVREAARGALLRAQRTRFFDFMDRGLLGLRQVTASFDDEEHKRHGYYFRRHVWEYIQGAPFLARTNLKPRGYAGDSHMMEMIYEDAFKGNSVFSMLLHRHPLASAAARAVRNRRTMVPLVLRRVQREFQPLPPRGFRFLSVACGPAFEVCDLLAEEPEPEHFHCALLDQDTEALATARAGIQRVQRARRRKFSVAYVNESVRTMLKRADQVDRLGRFHFVYSMGLFDYLTPPVARAVAKRLLELVVPGGTLLIGNYHVDNPTRRYMEYWMDWTLYYRTEAELQALLEDAEAASAELFFEDTGCQMFLQVRKPG